jgi:Helix-turn-helix domain
MRPHPARAADRPKRSTGELYDAIWCAELPPILDEHDRRAAVATEQVARLVLMAMARHNNPNRDQVYGPAREWQCFASVATIAEHVNTSERQVQRVLRTLERAGYIELLHRARRPGRPRNGDDPRRAGNTWCLRPDRWPTRSIGNRAGIGLVSGAPAEIEPVPAEDATGPARYPGNGAGTGAGGAEFVPVLSPEPGTFLTHGDDQHHDEPAPPDRARPRAGARWEEWETLGGRSDETTAHRVAALPRVGVVALRAPPPVAPTRTALCPDCGQQVSEDGDGHRRGADRCRAFGRGAVVGRCPRCGEWVDELHPSRWHTTRCPLKDCAPSRWSSPSTVAP